MKWLGFLPKTMSIIRLPKLITWQSTLMGGVVENHHTHATPLIGPYSKKYCIILAELTHIPAECVNCTRCCLWMRKSWICNHGQWTTHENFETNQFRLTFLSFEWYLTILSCIENLLILKRKYQFHSFQVHVRLYPWSDCTITNSVKTKSRTLTRFMKSIMIVQWLFHNIMITKMSQDQK